MVARGAQRKWQGEGAKGGGTVPGSGIGLRCGEARGDTLQECDRGRLGPGQGQTVRAEGSSRLEGGFWARLSPGWISLGNDRGGKGAGAGRHEWVVFCFGLPRALRWTPPYSWGNGTGRRQPWAGGLGSPDPRPSPLPCPAPVLGSRGVHCSAFCHLCAHEMSSLKRKCPSSS